MPHTQFLNLGQHIKRNIVNSQQIDNDLDNFIGNKNLANYPNIKKWIKTVVRNYIYQKLDTVIINDKELLPVESLELVNSKKILPPYDLIELSATFFDSISHTIDYLKSSFDNTKDLSRISWEQSQINAQVWLEERLRKLSTEEDVDNVITMKEIEKDGQYYRWVNIRSHKGLQRESKLMSHCIETYWDIDYPETKVIAQESPYYSLRDKNNKPIVTLFRETDSKMVKSFTESNPTPKEYDFIIGEIKEKGNTPLSNKNRELVDIFLEGRIIGMSQIEQTSSNYYHLYDTFKGIGPIQSINNIINEGHKFHCHTPLEIENFENDFPREKLLNIGNWKKLVINNKDNFVSLNAQEIHLSDMNSRGCVLLTSNLYLNNITNSAIALGLFSLNNVKSPETIRNFENIHNVDITLLNEESINTYYCFKNCSNVNVVSKAIHKLNTTPVAINIIKIDSTNININLPNYKNIIEIEPSGKYRFVKNIEDTVIIGEQYIPYTGNLETRNNFFIEMLSGYLQTQAKFNENDKLFSNFIKQLEVKIDSNYSVFKEDIFYINSKKYATDLSSGLCKILRSPNEFLRVLYQQNDPNLYKDYKDFIGNNSYEILSENLLEKFSPSATIIQNMHNKIMTALYNSRSLLVNVLNDPEDNFSQYMDTLISQDKENLGHARKTKLFLYMFKNEIVNQAIINYKEDNSTNHRFAFAEQRLTRSNCKRWVDFLQQRYLCPINKNEAVDILASPLDNNALLNKLFYLEQPQMTPTKLKKKI